MKENKYRNLAEKFIRKLNISRQLMSFHKPSIGYVGEELLRNFIRTIIPDGYKVCSGFIRQDYTLHDFPVCLTHSENKQSTKTLPPPQCDIIIFKDVNGAIDFECGDIAIVNREFVHMVIEVKTSIGPRIFEKTLKDFELINIGRKVLFIYTGPKVETIKKYFDNKSINIDNICLNANYLEDVVINNCVLVDDDIVIDKKENVQIKYKYDYSNFDNLPELIVSITPEKEFILSKDYVILESDYMGYNSLIFEDSKHKKISCLQELACYIDMSFGQDNYIPDISKINNFYAIPLFRI